MNDDKHQSMSDFVNTIESAVQILPDTGNSSSSVEMCYLLEDLCKSLRTLMDSTGKHTSSATKGARQKRRDKAGLVPRRLWSSPNDKEVVDSAGAQGCRHARLQKGGERVPAGTSAEKTQRFTLRSADWGSMGFDRREYAAAVRVQAGVRGARVR